MVKHVLVLGGTGRIGQSVARDLVQHTEVEIAIAGRNQKTGAQICDELGSQARFCPVDLDEPEGVEQAIADADLVIHCAGPFHHQQARILQRCIDLQTDYLDVCDSRLHTQQALALHDRARARGVTAVINTGVFPGISNSMVRLAVDHLDNPEQIHLSYVVSGSGGAGLTVMRTTFLGLQHPFLALRDGQWQDVQPYSEREAVSFPAPYGRSAVYWYDVPETGTLAESFPVTTVTTKFGSVPDLYNHLTWLTVRLAPRQWLLNPVNIEALSRISYAMTEVTDRFTGVGVAMRAEVVGTKDDQVVSSVASMVHANTAISAGAGTGSIAERVLKGQVHKPGVYPVEQAISTPEFQHAMQSRQLSIEHSLSTDV